MSITHSYVDYGAGNDTTGDGTVGTPWKTLQKAFDTLTRNTTDGNQVNLKAGTAHVNSATLDLTTFIGGGALSATAPLILRGYTSAANDGGIGEIDCGGATMWAASTYDYIALIDLKIHNPGDNNCIYLDDTISMIGCEVYPGASNPSNKTAIYFDTGGLVLGCYIHDWPSGYGIRVGNYSTVCGNYVDMSGTGIYANKHILGNIVVVGSTASVGIQTTEGGGLVEGNICYNTTAGTTYGIYTSDSGTSIGMTVINNIVVGWSGAGGDGIDSGYNIGFIGYNAFYNCTNNVTISDQKFIDLTASDVALAANPFTDAANGDFSLTDAAKTSLAAKGFPLAYLGAHANTVPNLNIGPIQMAAGGAAGGGFPILGGSVVR